MTKTLNMNDVLDAAHDLAGDPESGVDGEIVTAFTLALEQVLRGLAQHLATARSLTLGDVSYQQGFAGLCADFDPGPNGETCDIIGAGDEGGDWALIPPEVTSHNPGAAEPFIDDDPDGP